MPLSGPLSPRVLAEILDGGQAFRWRSVNLASETPAVADSPERRAPEKVTVWQGIWGNCVARLALDGPGGDLCWSAPASLASRVADELPRYLSTPVDFDRLADTLPWRSDPHLARCLVSFRGLRILRQPLGETLLCFLCSATKQIVQIRRMVDRLAQNHGTLIAPGYHRLPSWPELATVSEGALRECQLGFRARHVREVARFLAEKPGWLDQTGRLPYVEAKARLCQLPGVGEKIADCVLLFGAGRLEAFPVDTWITRTLQTRYGLTGWTPRQIATFGRIHFGPHAGLAQQYLFAWEREFGRSGYRPAP